MFCAYGCASLAEAFCHSAATNQALATCQALLAEAGGIRMDPNSLCLLHSTGEDRPQTRKHGVKVTADGVEQANITGEVAGGGEGGVYTRRPHKALSEEVPAERA